MNYPRFAEKKERTRVMGKISIHVRDEYRLAKPYRDILRYGDSVLRYILNAYWIASKGIEMDF